MKHLILGSVSFAGQALFNECLKKGINVFGINRSLPLNDHFWPWIKNQEKWPDLLLIDGGKTHLDYIFDLLKENELEDEILIAALAKIEETLYRVNKEPIVLDKRGRALIYARDEAHRFVNQFHRKSRHKNILKDPLENIEGVGAKKIQVLQRFFEGRQGLLNASIEDLCEVPGIGRSLAERIFTGLSK